VPSTIVLAKRLFSLKLGPAHRLLRIGSMLAQTDSSVCPFTVEITPTAWKQIAHLPQEMYRVLRERLRAVADLAPVSWHPLAERPPQLKTSLSFTVGEFAALYDADPQARCIRLLEVARRLPTDVSH
jgi:hypothetical protein